MKVSVLVASYQGKALLGPCLAALEQQRYRDFEVIVVDNGSNDGSRQWLAAWRGRLDLKTVLLPFNSGFASANAAGLKLASGELIALLNNDALPEPDWLGRAVASLAQRPEVGMLASCLLRLDDPSRLDSAGDQLNLAGRGLKRGEGLPARDYAEGAWVFSPCGAAAFYRRCLIDDVGFLDEDFFFNYEDLDLAFRAQLRGWRCWYEPAARVHHAVGASHALLGARTYYYWSRNAEWLWLKNAPAGLWWRTLPGRLAQELLTLLRHAGRPALAWAFLRGKAAAWMQLPRVLAQRRAVQAGARLDAAQVGALLQPGFEAAAWAAKWRRWREAA
jgi:GT2 family glycosyltransferase